MPCSHKDFREQAHQYADDPSEGRKNDEEWQGRPNKRFILENFEKDRIARQHCTQGHTDQTDPAKHVDRFMGIAEQEFNH